MLRLTTARKQDLWRRPCERQSAAPGTARGIFEVAEEETGQCPSWLSPAFLSTLAPDGIPMWRAELGLGLVWRAAATGERERERQLG